MKRLAACLRIFVVYEVYFEIAIGQGLFPGACPRNLARHPGLDDPKVFAKQISRTWYTYVRFYSPYYDDQCEKFTFEPIANSTVFKVTYDAVKLNGDIVKQVSYIRPGVFPNGDIWEKKVIPSICYDDRPFPTRLVDINPGVHLTLWSCDNITASGNSAMWRHEALWLLSATRPARDMNLAMNNGHLIAMHLNPGHFVFVNQSDCRN